MFFTECVLRSVSVKTKSMQLSSVLGIDNFMVPLKSIAYDCLHIMQDFFHSEASAYNTAYTANNDLRRSILASLFRV